MDHADANCSTAFQNDNICTAVEFIFGVSWKCFKYFAEKLLKFHCRISLTCAGFKYQLHSLKACRNGLEDKLSRTMSCMITRLKTVLSMANYGKEEQHMFYLRKPFEVIKAQMRLAQERLVFRLPHLWNINCSGMTHGTNVSWAHTIDSSFSKKVFECVREHLLKSADPLAVWHDHKGAGLQS